MNLEQRVSAFGQLGQLIQNELENGTLEPIITKAYHANQWFTPENIRLALAEISKHYLDVENINTWLSQYSFENAAAPKTIGLVMAGNIPLVGWHDLMTVVLSGNRAMVKLSSKDEILPKYLIQKLLDIAPALSDSIVIADRLQNFDAVIATGSGNTARYFEYYFGKYPNIIRRNRTSVAVLSGQESQEELCRLGEDIFTYFGLGCRNVSALLVPQGYSFNGFYEAIQPYAETAQNKKYFNNYEYYKSLLLLNKEAHLDNGFLLLKESNALASPVASLYFSYYTDLGEVEQRLEEHSEEIQCIVSQAGLLPESIAFGTAQHPELWDYADRVDTMAFLLSL